MKKGFRIMIRCVAWVAMAVLFVAGMTGCQTGSQNDVKKEPVVSEVPAKEEKAPIQGDVKKEEMEWPEAFDETEYYTGDFTTDPEGRLNLFVREAETQKLYCYALEDGTWVKSEIKNKKIHKILTERNFDERWISEFQWGDDGKLYCLCDLADSKEDSGGGQDVRAYLVCLGEDGTEFVKYRMKYSYNPMEINNYYVWADGRALIVYQDLHCELYSMPEKKVVKEFSPKIAKYGLAGVGDEIWRVGEYWLNMDVVDPATEESLRSFEHNFKRLYSKRAFRMIGHGNRIYLVDGNGIYYMNAGTDATFQTIEAADDKNKIGTPDFALMAFGTDKEENLYVSYIDKTVSEDEMKLVRYSVD